FLPELTRTLKSSHFSEPQASFFSKTEGPGANESPKIQDVSLLRISCKGGTSTLQANQCEHNIWAAPFFQNIAKPCTANRPNPRFQQKFEDEKNKIEAHPAHAPKKRGETRGRRHSTGGAPSYSSSRDIMTTTPPRCFLQTRRSNFEPARSGRTP